MSKARCAEDKRGEVPVRPLLPRTVLGNGGYELHELKETPDYENQSCGSICSG
jgi:hypothetical protein